MIREIKQNLNEIADESKAKLANRFFKSGKGEYGEHDIFIGISNPDLHIIAKKFKALTLQECEILLQDPIHEYRFVALLILVNQFPKSTFKKEIFDLYLKNINHINNWDLVDCSCRDIIGAYSFENNQIEILIELAQKDHLWSQRVAMVSTWYHIRKNYYESTLLIAKILIHHKHDLIHKAIGWMLREAWKKGAKDEVEDFLFENIEIIPRTALRYAIEKMDQVKKQYFMKL